MLLFERGMDYILSHYFDSGPIKAHRANDLLSVVQEGGEEMRSSRSARGDTEMQVVNELFVPRGTGKSN